MISESTPITRRLHQVQKGQINSARIVEWIDRGRFSDKVTLVRKDSLSMVGKVSASVAREIAAGWSCTAGAARCKVRTMTVPEDFDGALEHPGAKVTIQGQVETSAAAWVKRLEVERIQSERDAEGSHTAEQWTKVVTRYGGKCLACGYDGEITKDHVVPLSKGGSDFASNLQPLCRSCNSRKGIRSTDFRLAFAV